MNRRGVAFTELDAAILSEVFEQSKAYRTA